MATTELTVTTEERDEAMRETAKHIRRVQSLMHLAIAELLTRAAEHDAGKFSPEEWPYFAAATSQLRGITYGTAEYKAGLDAIRPGVDHHQATNSHHPEFYPGGVNDMDLFDLLEMLCDWKAATERHADGDLMRSLGVNRERFNIPEPIQRMLTLTADSLGFIDL